MMDFILADLPTFLWQLGVMAVMIIFGIVAAVGYKKARERGDL